MATTTQNGGRGSDVVELYSYSENSAYRTAGINKSKSKVHNYSMPQLCSDTVFKGISRLCKRILVYKVK